MYISSIYSGWIAKMMNNEFEKSFADFLDGAEYDKAADALFMVARAAFLAGWLAAGGENPKPQKIFTLYKNENENEKE